MSVKLGYYTVALPYILFRDSKSGFSVNGWVAVAQPITHTNLWSAEVNFNEHKTQTYRAAWRSKKKYLTRDLALRTASRAMIVLIEQERAKAVQK